MNSPPLRPEQLSPKLSPVAFSLDDPRNNGHNNGGNNLQHLLASPTKLKIDGNGSINGGGNSLIYRTSLSKLSELSRTGRSRQRSNSDTLRSASPIRLQFFNNGPKMLKPEYVAPAQQPAGMPLLSALIAAGPGTQTGRLSIRETLEMLHMGLSAKNRPPPEEAVPAQTQQSGPVASAEAEDTTDRREKNHNSNHKHKAAGGMTPDVDGTLRGKPVSSPRDNHGARMASNSSVASSTMTVNFNDMSKEMDLELLDTDKNGFVELADGKGNRCSFISSSSTDFDPDWYHQQQSHISEETAKLDYRIKQLELEIDELKLQNEKLIRSITTSRTVEDKFMLDALKEIRFSKQRAQRGMERKVKQLERKVENYRKVMRTIGDSPVHAPIVQHGHHGHHTATAAAVAPGGSPRRQNCRRRIARISSVELRKIEEQNDSSSCPSSSSSSSPSDGEHDATPEDGTQRLDVTTTPKSEPFSIRRIRGLQLNIQLETQRDRSEL